MYTCKCNWRSSSLVDIDVYMWLRQYIVCEKIQYLYLNILLEYKFNVMTMDVFCITVKFDGNVDNARAPAVHVLCFTTLCDLLIHLYINYYRGCACMHADYRCYVLHGS